MNRSSASTALVGLWAGDESLTNNASATASIGSISPLVRYSLRGLRRCWLPDHGRWSHKYHFDGRSSPNESRPYSDIYYSLNVLLGFAQVRPVLASEPYDLAVVFAFLCREALKYPVRHGAWGMAMWVAAELGFEVPGAIYDKLRSIATEPTSISGWSAQDVGLTLSGVSSQLPQDASLRPLADSLRNFLMTRLRSSGALFRDSDRGVRRHFATFATQVYSALSLYQYGETINDELALAAANDCVERLIVLQGPFGEWPWLYRPGADLVLDPYEVYSVHQHGMAPAVLHHAVRHGVPGARAATERGFAWVFGANKIGVSMLVPSLQLIYRSQARCGLRARREMRPLTAAISLVASRHWSKASPTLRLTPEMRSYEFGWLLWSFGSRTDYPSFTHHADFTGAVV